MNKLEVIRGMRNHFVHGYDIMDIEVIYNTAKEDIPILKEFIDKHIKSLSSEKTE